MKLAISNIAWERGEDKEIAAVLAIYQVKAIEIAPTKIWPTPIDLPAAEVSSYREFWEAHGIPIVAFQALLFGQPELLIFGTADARARTLQYLTKIIELAARLGARALVFGSPKNRLAGQLKPTAAFDIAATFFGALAEIAYQHQICLCIEPNPPQYGCDFIQTAAEGLALVQQVNHPGFRLHLDAGAMTMNGESYEEAIEHCLEYVSHFHISEPGLTTIGAGDVDHKRIAKALRKVGYDKFVSVEMLNKSRHSNITNLTAALDFVTDTYL